MAFSRKIDFRYHCLTVDKRFVSTRTQIVDRLERQLREFLSRHADLINDYSELKVYYDCGQSEVSRILHNTIEASVQGKIIFAEGVEPTRYKLFQVADLVCTVKLLELKLQKDEPLTESEQRFFGGPRDFKRNILKKLKTKDLL